MVPLFARQIVDQTPNPPRTVPKLRLLSAVLTTHTSFWLVGLAVVPLVCGFVAVGNRSDSSALAVGIGFISFGLFMASVPMLFWRRLLRCLESEPVGFAEVQDVEIEYQSQNTIDATRNGFARGTWQVSTDDGLSFIETFEVDEPFARKLRRGSRVKVIVDSRKRRSAFNLALVDGA